MSELWFLCTALPLNEIYISMKFQVSSLNTYWVMIWTNFKNENEQGAITPKVWSFELWFLCTALLLNEIYIPMKFQVNALHSFKVMLRTKFKNENEQRAITPKVWSFEVWFLYTALLLNEIYLPMKFHVYALHSFKVMLGQKRDGRTDRGTCRMLYATLPGYKKHISFCTWLQICWLRLQDLVRVFWFI